MARHLRFDWYVLVNSEWMDVRIYTMARHLTYSETSLIRHSMGPKNNVGLGGCRIMEGRLPYYNVVTVLH